MNFKIYPKLLKLNNYNPFGMLSLRNPELDLGLQPGRYWQSGDYRFGYITKKLKNDVMEKNENYHDSPLEPAEDE